MMFVGAQADAASIASGLADMHDTTMHDSTTDRAEQTPSINFAAVARSLSMPLPTILLVRSLAGLVGIIMFRNLFIS